MANVYADGTLDASVYDDSKGLPGPYCKADQKGRQSTRTRSRIYSFDPKLRRNKMTTNLFRSI